MREKGREWLWKIYDEAWNQQKILEELENDLLVPIYKFKRSTELRKVQCYLPIISGLLKFLQGWLKKEIETKLLEEQPPFRPSRQTNDNIFIILNLIERKIEETEELLTFIDLRAAFDKMNRISIWNCLKRKVVDLWLTEIEKMKMTVNTDKNKINVKQRREIKWEGISLKRVSQYKYLGSVIPEDERMEIEITNGK